MKRTRYRSGGGEVEEVEEERNKGKKEKGRRC